MHPYQVMYHEQIHYMPLGKSEIVFFEESFQNMWISMWINQEVIHISLTFLVDKYTLA